MEVSGRVCQVLPGSPCNFDGLRGTSNHSMKWEGDFQRWLKESHAGCNRVVMKDRVGFAVSTLSDHRTDSWNHMMIGVQSER